MLAENSADTDELAVCQAYSIRHVQGIDAAINDL